MEPTITVESVSKYFYRDNDRHTAVHDVSLRIMPGSFVSVIGPSGCGKSTILNMIAGLLEADEGRILHGQNAVAGPAAGVGYLTQHDSLLPWRSIRDNVRLPLQIQRNRRDAKAEDEAKVQWALDLVHLNGFEKHMPREVSGGMLKRAALAQILVYARDTFLMDEPFGALDSQTRLELQRQLMEICARERRTVVFVTHDIEEAIALSDEIVVLETHPGRVKEIVHVDLPRPRDPVTVRFDPNFQQLFRRVWGLMHPDDMPVHPGPGSDAEVPQAHTVSGGRR